MIIKNPTPEIQEIVVREIVGTRSEYTFYINPYGSLDLDSNFLLVKEKTKGSIEVVEEPKKTVIPPVPTPTPVDEDLTAEETDPTVSTEVEIVDKFICEKCGAEFASARGLTSHMNKLHAE